jgi:hypothetical protein
MDQIYKNCLTELLRETSYIRFYYDCQETSLPIPLLRTDTPQNQAIEKYLLKLKGVDMTDKTTKLIALNQHFGTKNSIRLKIYNEYKGTLNKGGTVKSTDKILIKDTSHWVNKSLIYLIFGGFLFFVFLK